MQRTSIESTTCITKGFKTLHYPTAVAKTIMFPVGVFNSVLTKTSLSFSDSVNDGINVTWSFTEAAYVTILGAHQIYQGDYRSGLINLISGAELSLLTYAPWLVKKTLLEGSSAAAFAAPAFTFALLLDLVNACLDHCQLARESEFEVWLEARLKELDEMDGKIAELKAAPPTEGESLDVLNKEKEDLENDITSYTRYYFRTHSMTELSQKELFLNQFIREDNRPNLRSAMSLTFVSQSQNEINDEKRVGEIQANLNQRLEESRSNIKMKAFSLANMTLISSTTLLKLFGASAAKIAFASAILNPLGVGLMAGVAVYSLIYKNRNKISKFCGSFYNSIAISRPDANEAGVQAVIFSMTSG